MLDKKIENLKKIKNKKEFLLEEISNTTLYLKEINTLKTETEKEFNLLEDSFNTLKSILEETNKEFLNEIEIVLSTGLQEIMYDRDYSIKIITSDENKQLDIIFYDNSQQMELDLDDGIGDSIKTIIGVILQIFMIINLDLEKILIVDEGFTALDYNYKDNFFSFINKLIEKENFKIFLVTHDLDLLQYATKSLSVKSLKEGSFITEVSK